MSSLPFRSATIPQDRLLPGIHGLRGIAALAVVLFHVVHLAKLKEPDIFSFIASDFGYGVHLFFILSAYSLLHSTEHTMHRMTWSQEYFIKRFWRIAPLYYFVLVFMVWKSSLLTKPVGDVVQTILLNLTFTFGFAPWSGIVWAGWSVGVEMIFYALFPVLLLNLRSASATFWAMVASLMIAYASRSILHVHFEHNNLHNAFNWSYFSFLPNLYFFAAGMYIYRLSAILHHDSLLMRWVIPAGSLLLLGLLLFTSLDLPLKGMGRIDLMLWGAGLVGLTLWQGTRPSAWCANRFFEYIGERSYSIYLLHPIVISILLQQPLQNLYATLAPHIGTYAYFICLILLLVPLLLIAELTYRCIEVPGIRFGQRLNRKIREAGLP